MRRFGLIISVLALVLGLSQCKRQRPEMPHYNGPIGGKVIQHVTVNTTRDNGGGDSKVSLLSLTTKLKLQWDGTEKIYVYDGTCMCGVLRFSKYISADHSEATFVGEINTVVGRKLRFYHFNNVAEDDVPGFEGNNKTLSRDYSTQDAKQITSIIPGFVLRSDETEISSDGEYNGIIMKLPFSVMRTKFSGFGSSNINLTGMGGTGYSIDKTGALTVNENTSATLTAPGTEDFYIVFMPKVGAHYKFSNASGIGETTWTLAANVYYTESGSASGEAVLITGRTPAASPTSVTTNLGCSGYIYAMGGTVTLKAGAAQEVEYGFVCSQSVSTPEVGAANCFKVVGGTVNMQAGTTSFSVDITDLTVGTTYYVRAYAIGESGAVVHAPNSSAGIKRVKGGDFPWKLPSTWTNGTNPHPFTVGIGTDGIAGTEDDVKVYFSQGNLQYIGSASTPYWKFADHQFDFLSTTTGQNSETETVDRDLFGWGTSGQDHGATCYQPWSTSDTYSHYYAYGSGHNHLYSKTPATADWGYNTIYAGGVSTTGWRTFTTEEVYYLFRYRTNASKLYGHGKIGSCTTGMIILPDDWTCPAGLTFTPGSSSWSNVYSYTDWSKMESAGAVFLPAAGIRNGTTISGEGSTGYYWASSYFTSQYVYTLYFYTDNVGPKNYYERRFGFPIRLVR